MLKSTSSVSVQFLRPENNNDKTLQTTALKMALLNGLTTLGMGGSAASAIPSLNTRLASISAERAGALLREEKNAIDSYLSQSQFGLASLYDKK